jgi:transcriptional regulator
MYLRGVHAETAIPVLRQFIHDNPLGILTTAIKTADHAFIQSSHIPFVLDVPDDSEDSPGVLRGHIAKQNPQAKALMEALAAQQEAQGKDIALELPDEVLVLFNGPHHHYVTPKFYTETKPVTGKVVPTWNYAAVQAYGKIRVFCNSKSEETGTFLQTQVEDLSKHAETSEMGYTGAGGKPTAWKVGDAPTSYVDLLKKNIIGIEIQIERLQGKFKMSQEMGQGDREGVIKGFGELGTDVGDGIAKMVQERGR